jgi:protein SCO1/2
MERKLLWAGLAVVILLGLASAGVMLTQKAATLRGSEITPAQPAPEINLKDQNGRPFQLSALRGKVVLLYFGYTSCPDVCPTTLADLRQVRSMLGDKGQDVQVVFITVDPDRDTPDRLQSYVSAFDPSFLGLGGSLSDLEPVYQSYGVYREIDKSGDSAGGYSVTHTARVYLIDPQGNLRLTYSFGTLPEDIAHDIRVLLKG